ncbi:hypothetical protein ANSO36C_33700 [Nostoc cf. commune SO-36]|uniref:DNA-3-methyladenine glycosylase II n=1 Tax=Nostoc cf. commune SO-36 TaxID=449208 RepID=A0ABM7Z3I6_NOSCO|nr:hypothetical protein [Nostoc commune]BDI17568.1 hypothetical protein ANSO36C_33700 [Nostoc cf. commune SO-36]
MAQIPELESLTEESLTRGLMVLANLDSDLAWILETLGPPPMWQRQPGFATLLCIILEQQVSVAAAKAVFTRLCGVVVTLTPENFLILDDAQLKAIGFSRQKIYTVVGWLRPSQLVNLT